MTKKEVMVFGAIILGVVTLISSVVFLVSGPVGIQNQYTAWKASAFGSNWYIVHYLPDGSLNEFYLENSAIHSDDHSGGVYFSIPEQGKNVTVHVNTLYEYVQDPTPEVIRGLRGSRKVGFSNVPAQLLEVAR